MRILFIYPNADSQLGFHYGIAHLSSVLKKAGHKVALWQLCEDIAPLPSRPEFKNRLRKEAPDVIGFSVVTNQWGYTRELAAWAREAVSATLVCGGIHAMAAPEQVLDSGLFDYIIRGEAEDALLEFVEKLDRSEDVSGMRNLGWKDSDGIHLNPVRTLPRLNDLPFKDYDIFDFQKLIDAKDGWVGLMASRGCPFACTYCFNHQMVRNYRDDLNCSFKELNYIRHFEIDRIITEIKYLLANYENIQMFIFDDDLFTFYSDYVKAFSEAYQKVSSLPFVVNAHVGFFDEQRARYLAEAGCKIVKFGVESGSSRIRRQVMRRHMKNESIIAAIKTAGRVGLHTSVFLMIGLPDEGYDDVMATIKLMAAAMPGRYRWTYFYPYPNTAAYDIAFEKGYIDEERLARIKNFTDRSGLDFGEEHNLFLEKVGKVMPWFVNANSDLPVAGFYREKTAEILTLSRTAWRKRAEHILDEDRAFSDRFVKEGLRHYAIKYNPFMGVISDYFTAEE